MNINPPASGESFFDEPAPEPPAPARGPLQWLFGSSAKFTTAALGQALVFASDHYGGSVWWVSALLHLGAALAVYGIPNAAGKSPAAPLPRNGRL